MSDILRYTGINVYDDEVELYSFSSVKDFDRFISSVEFEMERLQYLEGV